MPAFRLARVLRVRTRLRERAQEDLREAVAALAAVHERATALEATVAAARAAEEAAEAHGITAAELVRFRTYQEARAADATALADEAARLAEEVERRRLAVVERRREERQLERLRERNDEREAATEARRAAVLLDDLARR